MEAAASLSSSSESYTSDDEEIRAYGDVDDADWELSRGGTSTLDTYADFTKQYNRARQIASAVHERRNERHAGHVTAGAVALPPLNRVRRAATPAKQAGASEESVPHTSKTAAQISALAQYANCIHIDKQYDPSLGAGGSVDSRVPRKTNQPDNKRKDKADRATLQQVLDPRTLVILYKMIRRELLEVVNGCVSTGKEASVFHAMMPAREGQCAKSAAVKIYKTSILVFKDRDRYVSGEYRFRHGYSRHNPRKMVRLWAEKEMRNLKRLVNAGLRAPNPIELRDHVLVMQFLGDADGWASPRLKDAEPHIPADAWPRLYCQLMASVRRMYHQCRLVHADLSEYNILYHEDHLWIIDVSQSVEHDHPHAFDFLREDISHVEEYFGKRGVQTLGLRRAFHFIVRGAPQVRHGGLAGLEKLELADAQIDDAVLHAEVGGPKDESEAGLVAQIQQLLEEEVAEDAAQHEEAVFRQSYIPRNLDEVFDPERDAQVTQEGQSHTLIYSGVSGMDQVLAEHNAEEDDKEDDTTESELENDSDSDSSDSSSDALAQGSTKALRKEHKKQVKAANRERRKTKMPKAEKKRKMKKSSGKKK
ncbi:non-specific serine/threonine protein kinase [Malassezia vespertilionis]|uniref:Serine/threonine-protein kinase RIO1 n=1 Tax=Malassezia vespertilionis TaxID=2020962 RepID=A0A2N1JD06_9BASI|nr:non-specific serine/threonine protein kinase [Malassezia vespertilionis]PKI84419.1 Rio1p [Malassezia vespertilionis]WFD06459.1 non-specific serine/threonine protein kinase [Malassezia vespertilionis]